MADIPSYFAQQPLERERLPRAPAGIADVGAGIEAGAMARAAGALQKVSGTLADIQAEKQRGRDNATLADLADQERDFVFGSYNVLEQYVGTEIKDFGKLEESFAKDWDKKIKKLLKDQNKQVKEHFTLWSKQNRAKILQDYHIRVWPKEQSFAQGKAISIADKHLRRGDLKSALQTYDQHAQYFPPKTLQGLKGQAEDLAIEYQKQAFLNTAHEAAKAMPYTDAISYLNDLKGITSAERNDLITRRKRREEIETASHNDGVYWDTLRKLTEDRDSISDDELEALVKPDSLSVDDWKELAEMKKPDGLLSKPSVKTALTLFDNLKTAGAFVGKDPADMTLAEKRENIQLWADIKNDFIKWIQDNPNATEDQIEKKQKMLTEPERKEITLNWLQRLLLKKKGRQLFGLVKSEAELLAEKKREAPKTLTEIDIKGRAAREAKIRAAVVPLNLKYKTRLQPSLLDDTSDEFFGIWSKLDDDKKLKVLQALENGYSEQEVLTALE